MQKFSHSVPGQASPLPAGPLESTPRIQFRSLGAVTLCSLLQLILQFLLVVWLAKRFGTSPLMDAFNAAFAVPTALTGILVSPIPMILVPELVRLRSGQAERTGWRLAATILLAVLLVAGLLAGLGSFASEAICHVLFAGLEPFRLNATVDTLQWLIWLVPLNAAIALLQAMHHARQKYLLAAMSNVLGVGISFALIVAIPSLDLRAVSVALLTGSAFAVAILLLPIVRPLLQNMQYCWTGIGLRRFAGLVMPLLLSAAYAKLDPLVDRSIASFLDPGAISELGYAQRVITALGTLAASGLSVVIFPQLAELAADPRDPRLTRLLAMAWRFLTILLVPCVAAIVFFGKPIVADLFQREAFDAGATAAVARLLVILLGVLIASSVGEIAAKCLYAMSETRLPALIAVSGFTLGIALKWVLSKSLGVEGVALGTTLYFVFCLSALLVTLSLKTGPAIFDGLGLAMVQAGTASAAALIVGAVPVMLLATGGAFLGGFLGLMTYLAVLWLWKNEFLPAGRQNGPTAPNADTRLPVSAIPCPLCHENSFVRCVVARDYVYHVPGIYRFVRCRACDHVYLNPRPSDDSLAACYPTEYAPHLSDASGAQVPPAPPASVASAASASAAPARGDALPLHKRFIVWLFEQHGTIVFSPPATGEHRLLEIGCAHGSYLETASAGGWHADGIEPNPAAAARARQRGFFVTTGTFTAAQLPAASREAIVAWMVLEHVPDPREFVEEAFRVLVPGGRFAVSIPNARSLDRVLFRDHWVGYDAPRHLQVFTPRRLRALLEELGFEDVRVQHQANIRYWWGSAAACGMDWLPNARWPHRWMQAFVQEPPPLVRYLSVVPAKLLALLHCSGRINITATKPPR